MHAIAAKSFSGYGGLRQIDHHDLTPSDAVPSDGWSLGRERLLALDIAFT
jgi:hypothetical protein